MQGRVRGSALAIELMRDAKRQRWRRLRRGQLRMCARNRRLIETDAAGHKPTLVLAAMAATRRADRHLLIGVEIGIFLCRGHLGERNPQEDFKWIEEGRGGDEGAAD